MTDEEFAELRRLAHLYGTTELDQHASIDLPDDLRLTIVRASSDDSASGYVRAELTRLTVERDEARAAAHHIWTSFERGDGLSDAEVRGWWPWMDDELAKMKAVTPDPNQPRHVPFAEKLRRMQESIDTVPMLPGGDERGAPGARPDKRDTDPDVAWVECRFCDCCALGPHPGLTPEMVCHQPGRLCGVDRWGNYECEPCGARNQAIEAGLALRRGDRVPMRRFIERYGYWTDDAEEPPP